MANINTSLLIAAPMLQDLLVDPSTGQPLAAGTVTFYQDNARTTLKNAYYQVDSGTTPPVYSYIAFNNPLTLGAGGTIQDGNGNDVIPYFYPYSEDPNDPPGTPQAYYIVVKDSGGAVKLTRSNFPYVALSSNTDNSPLQNLINLIPNGQFLSHNNLPNNGTLINGTAQVSAISTGTTSDTTNTSVIVAQGGAVGWYFIKSSTSTSTDVITFQTLIPEPNTVTGNPRFAIDINCTASANEPIKELRIRFNNVNRFATSQTYTFGLSGVSLSGTAQVKLNYIKYFGVNGSAPIVDSNKDTYTFDTTGYKAVYTPFSLGSNAQYTIDPNGGDYVEICLGLPVNQLFHIRLTDSILTPGQISITSYPERPDHEVLDKAIAGSVNIPDPSGNDLYLPMVLTPGGATFDHSVIGKVSTAIYSTPNKGELLCDGTTYQSSAYSNDGIPYARLQKVLFNNGASNIPLYGTGNNFATCYIWNGDTTSFFISNNSFGSGANALDNNTGFSHNVVRVNTASSLNLNAYFFAANKGILKGIITEIATTHNDTGIVFTSLRSGASNNYNVYSFDTTSVTVTGLGGKYFTYTANSTPYYVWFKYNGTGADPAPGGTGIEIDLFPNMSVADLAIILGNALNGGADTYFTATAPASIIDGSWFHFQTANGNTFYVWYYKGAGNDPKPNGYTLGIKVDISASTTAAQVATATQIAINSAYYAVPDFRGMFLRGYDSNSFWDKDNSTRFGMTGSQIGNLLGTFELDQFLSHTHSGSSIIINPVTMIQNIGTSGTNGPANTNQTTGNGTFTPTGSVTIANAGGSETRPVNAAVNYFIRY